MSAGKKSPLVAETFFPRSAISAALETRYHPSQKLAFAQIATIGEMFSNRFYHALALLALLGFAVGLVFTRK